MKRLTTIFAIFAIFALISTPAAFACDGPNCFGSGNFDIKAKALGGGIDYDYRVDPSREKATGGISGAGGATFGHAKGNVTNGKAKGFLDLTGGGVTNTESEYYRPEAAFGIGVYSFSDSHAQTTANLKVVAKKKASSSGGFLGVAGQGSLDGSYLGDHRMNTKGETFGMVGQGSTGLIFGCANTSSKGKKRRVAEVDAGISMDGFSSSFSERGIIHDGSWTTDYFASGIEANTAVDSWVSERTKREAYTRAGGGFLAIGGGTTKSNISGSNGFGKASASGSYMGVGELGCNYTGGLSGSTYTNYSTLDGYNGAIVSSGASMSVTSKMSTGPATE